MSIFLIRRNCEIARSDYELHHVCLFVHPFAWINSAPTGWILQEI